MSVRATFFVQPLASLVAAIFLLVSSATSVEAALTWEKTSVTLPSSIEATEAIAYFHFRNTGTSNISVVDLQASCGCTVPTVEKQNYTPGESGSIKVIFKFGDYVGEQEKVVRVVTSDAPSAPLILTLRVTIPRTFTIEPRGIFWKVDDSPESSTKSVILKSIVDHPIKILSVEVGSPEFSIITSESSSKDGYIISVTPPSPKKPLRSYIRVKFQSPSKVTRERMVLLVVQ